MKQFEMLSMFYEHVFILKWKIIAEDLPYG